MVFVELLSELPWEQRLYAWPWAVVYGIWTWLWLFKFESVFGSSEFAFLALILACAAHALSFLACHWSVRLRARLTCRIVDFFIIHSLLRSLNHKMLLSF